MDLPIRQVSLFKPDGGLQLVNNKLSMAPMQLLWSGFGQGDDTLTLRQSPRKISNDTHHFRLRTWSNSYRTTSVPAAVGLTEVSSWYIDVAEEQILEFKGDGHKTVKVTKIGTLNWSVHSIYGQL